jgi:hypothetical protein
MMNGYISFNEFLEQRDAACRADTPTSPLGARGIEPVAGSATRYVLREPEAAGDEGQIEARSIFGKFFKSPSKAVNPSRPVLPTNSRLLASPFRKKRLKSQVVGR